MTRPLVVPPGVGALAPWVDAGVFGAAEIHGAEVLTRSLAGVGPTIQLGAACALWAPLHGHACLDLERVITMVAAELAATVGPSAPDAEPDPGAARVSPRHVASSLPWPMWQHWQADLRGCPLVRVVDGPDATPVLDERPLVLHGALLYTQRQWVDECIVAAAVAARAAGVRELDDVMTTSARSLLDELLPSRKDDRPNRQHEAAAAALRADIAVIVGGPGTGKTHTVARLLAVALADARARGEAVRIGLAAPTGKAAARLSEAIGAAASSLDLAAATALTALTPVTVHRLLGWAPSATRFQHGPDNHVPYDIVVVDEASMIALPLMARLLEAIAPAARIVLVGDPDQLASIEVGAVLSDIVAAAERSATMQRCVVRLDRGHRQAAESAIVPLADAVRSNNPDVALAILHAHDGLPTGDVQFVSVADPGAPAAVTAARAALLPALAACAEAARGGDAQSALAEFATVRTLCAHRSGQFGVDGWNRAIETWLLAAAAPSASRLPRFYPGRPLLATRNDVRLHVANGDTGVVVHDPHQGGVRAAFATATGIRALSPAQLESVETAFATTIHKSQGSEFDTVVVVVPPPGSPLAGRELLYTAITRAKRRLIVIGSEESVRACITRPSMRITGLAEAIASIAARRPVP